MKWCYTMTMEKNEIYEVTIEDMSEDGAGIGHIDGIAIFVKDTVVGDKAKVRIVKVKKNYMFGRLEELISPSEFRVEPECPVARQCGGCTLQHISYEEELELKKNRVLNCLSRIGGIEHPEAYLEGVFGMGENCFRYRNKMQFPIGRNKEGKTVTGFYAGRTHTLIETEDCILGHPVNRYITDAVSKWADKNIISVYDEKSCKGLLRHILTRVGRRTGELMVCLVINGKKSFVEEELIEALKASVDKYNADYKNGINGLSRYMSSEQDEITLASVVLNINQENTNKILGDRTVCIYGTDYITDYIGDIQFRISAQSFYQVNPLQTEKLYQKALEYADLNGSEKVWDMYCGIGTISLFLSKKANQVYGVEIVPQAIEDAKKNAKLNDIKNAEFFTGSAEDVVTEMYMGTSESDHKECIDKYKADVVVVDPPRKGCDDKLLQTIKMMEPRRMVYVSCDPATLARDLKTLLASGFTLEKFSVYDQFSRSMHVETVCLLTHLVVGD